MQVIVTMAGEGLRFLNAGYDKPKPIVDLAGRPVIDYLIKSFDVNWKLIFCIGEHFQNSDIEKIILKIKPDSKIIYTKYSERGPIDTVLAAVPFLNSNEPILVSYCDLALVWNCADFTNKVQKYDLAVINYQGFHPTYFGPNTYCHVNVDSEKSEVISLQEKKLFTNLIESEVTSAGVYYFKNKDILVKALQSQIEQNLKYGNEFYISLAIQALLNLEKIKVLDYRVNHVSQFGTPEDIQRFQFWYDTLILEKKSLAIKSVDFDREKNYWLTVFKWFSLDKNYSISSK